MHAAAFHFLLSNKECRFLLKANVLDNLPVTDTVFTRPRLAFPTRIKSCLSFGYNHKTKELL